MKHDFQGIQMDWISRGAYEAGKGILGNMHHFGSFSQPLGDIQNFSLSIPFLYSNNSSFPA